MFGGREGLLFAATAFLSASLLFSVQPMIGRMLAPLLGGAPAVWNTCLVFFQTILLLGYAYSHWLGTRCSARTQQWAQAALLAAACVALPLAIPAWASANVPVETPIRWLLVTLTIAVGLPFFALSTQSSMLQLWLARRGRTPFFLYAASNAGSLLALLAYPILIEPTLRMAQQTRTWMGGFALMIPLVWVVGRPQTNATTPKLEVGEAIPWNRKLNWILLAFVPSSLLQAVTSYLTADIASLPLLWVLPLALYLLTFIIAFAESGRLDWRKLDFPLVVGAVALAYLLARESSQPIWLVMFAHLAFFTIACLYCHLRLSNDRPQPGRLTEFYLWMSVGGALGGFFNALVAPHIFSRIAEYPIAIILACLLRPGLWRGTKSEKISDFSLAIVFAILAGLAGTMARVMQGDEASPWPPVAFGVVALLCFFTENRPLRLALGLSGLLIGSALAGSTKGRLLHVERNFFGVVRVTSKGSSHRLYHGTTIHGVQDTEAGQRCEPLAYYHRGSGLDRMWQLAHKTQSRTNIALVGLGAGATVVYAKPAQRWSIYEIDPAMIRIAQDPLWFDYLKCVPNAKFDFFLGDARLRLNSATNGGFEVMIMDAFSSDSVPMHLLTREAMRLYLDKLAPGGMIFMHISSRNLHLDPVVVNTATAEGFACYRPTHVRTPDDQAIFDANWVLLVRPGDAPSELSIPKEWTPLIADKSKPTWTDDFRNLWSVIQMR